MFSGVEFTGTLTGRRFHYDTMRCVEAPGRWEGPGVPTMPGCHPGTDDRGEPVFVRVVRGFAPVQDAGKLRRARHAIEVAQGAAVIECPTLVQLIDFEDREAEADEFGGPYATVSSAWQWGERVLLDVIDDGRYAGSALAANIERNIGAALGCLHRAGLVHSDVAPNNIVEVGGMWKLADFDQVVRVGDPVTGLPRSTMYVLDGTAIGVPATPAMDQHGLQTMLDAIRAHG
jgi:hypothetical protein